MTDSDAQRGGPGAAPGRPPHPIYNWMSGIGSAVFAVGGTVVAFLLLLEVFLGQGSGYGGLALLPPFGLALFGLALVIGGWLRERRRQQRGERSSFFGTWVVDPWSVVRRHGPWVVPLVAAVITFAVLAGGAGSVALLGFSESNTFCTEACHSVMGPEGTAYAHTAHARIDCVKCHVGAGPEGFLSAKLGGLRQLYAFATGTVSRPIPTPIHAANIDRKLCESCHVPERDIGFKARAHSYFLSGEDVEPVRLAMMVKVGRGPNGMLLGEGVHYHMQIAEKVEFIARDEKSQEIAWVRVTDSQGKAAREYQLESNPLSDEERASLPVRTMECIDCHSRPAHRFTSAIDSVNLALKGGRLSRELPSIKEVAVQALDGGYETTAAALEGIDRHVREYYEEEYPEVLEEEAEALDASIAALQTIYQQTIFPEMKADWRAHPDNIGHRDWPGCFRCHNDEMLDADGESVATKCSTCHAILAQDESSIETMDDFDTGQAFVHPEDGDTFGEFTLCSECHTGGKELYE